jgi:hypothetical protein
VRDSFYFVIGPNRSHMYFESAPTKSLFGEAFWGGLGDRQPIEGQRGDLSELALSVKGEP